MACFALLALVGLCAAAPDPTGPAGRLVVVDGDTFDVGGERVRLHGVDAPEAAQRCETPGGADWACGDWVTQEVTLRFAGREAVCAEVDTDRYGRIVARCAIEGRDLGEAIVSAGLALAYEEYSDAYVNHEREARDDGRGIWRGTVQDPADWRRGRREARAEANAPAPGECTIKGNVSGGGRIYHLPQDPFYGRTKIDTGKGERWFCSEAEARRAGWRHAGS
ncbi:thermonuclease family protein [Limimaricola pyoseonensis]|uniref:Endonuclease YncB, thermonuclease family n=1 Tax=Limimaricola pyoseonensis TaxID=521013 RepID=A0A1G7D1I8_9RHOB|nr:thermonuclease family protein [Limimaricola pyoseonensis]SDE44776.1 Endonuclease YncB, thermonuclease family [Limimaricola pyoseonensis]